MFIITLSFSLATPFLPCTSSLEPSVIPTAQASIFLIVCYSKYEGSDCSLECFPVVPFKVLFKTFVTIKVPTIITSMLLLLLLVYYYYLFIIVIIIIHHTGNCTYKFGQKIGHQAEVNATLYLLNLDHSDYKSFH
jgi:hypothetical protein